MPISSFAGMAVTGMVHAHPGQNKRFVNLDGASTGEGRNFGFASTVTPNPDGTYNDVARWGWNVGDGGMYAGRLETDQPAAYYAIENKWLAGGRHWSEFHQYQITDDDIVYRPFSAIYPHDGGRGSGAAFNVDRFSVSLWDDNTHEVFGFDTIGNRFDTTEGCLVGIGGAAQTGRALKVYGMTEVTGQTLLGGSVKVGAEIIDATDEASYIAQAGGGWRFTNRTDVENVPMSVKGMADQAGALSQWLGSDGSVLAEVQADGSLHAAPVASAPDAPASGWVLYADVDGDGTARCVVRFPTGDPVVIGAEL